MAFMNEYPYSDFNEYNMDWIIKTVKDLSVAWAETKTEWGDMQTEWTNYKNYIDNYFENLDVSQEISDKIDQMAADGTLLSIMSETVTTEAASVTSAWIADNLLQEVGYVIDNSLTVPGAAADAKTAGDLIGFNKYTAEQNPYDFSLEDIFSKLESGFIDDFLARADFIDSDHVYTSFGDDTEPPTITTGVGATRINPSATRALWYARPINAFPFMVAIGKVDGAQQSIKLYNDSDGATSNVIIINAAGIVTFSGTTYGKLHKNTAYHFLYITENGVSIFDDTGINVFVPLAYTLNKPKTIAIGFGVNPNRLFGYASYIEFIKKPISAIDIDKSVYDQETEVSPQADTITTYFTHSYGAGISDFYTKPADNPYTEKITSDHTNNLCIKCEADYDDDTGYRTEIAIRPIKSSLKDTYGGLQRFDFSADYYMDSDYNIDNNDYYTYIFQLHDANFSVAGWTDAPPLALRVIGGKIYAYVAYIDTGNIPAGDNVHTSDGYLLGDFEMDKWHHIEVKARIGWKTSLLSKLTIALDGVEVLDIKTPIGFNIVSSDGWVNVQTGLYIPEWRTGTYTDRHREIMISNIKWKGTQHLVS